MVGAERIIRAGLAGLGLVALALNLFMIGGIWLLDIRYGDAWWILPAKAAVTAVGLLGAWRIWVAIRRPKRVQTDRPDRTDWRIALAVLGVVLGFSGLIEGSVMVWERFQPPGDIGFSSVEFWKLMALGGVIGGQVRALVGAALVAPLARTYWRRST